MQMRRWMVGCGAAVVLTACGGSGTGPDNPLQPPPGPAVPFDTVLIVDNAFGPEAVKITLNGTLTFEWAGTNVMQHNVRWASGPTIPPPGPTQATGAPFEVTFAQAGTYEFVCTLHTAMQGAVFVE